MSQDKMQDVFPVEIDFVSGEMPDGVKFTGWSKQTDTAFSNITEAIGDPWDVNAHQNIAGDSYKLSPVNLAQSSLARIIGPSDYASPQGASANEAITTSVNVTLEKDRNSWRLGFPLVKKSGANDISPSVSGGVSAVLTGLVWDTDMNCSDGSQFLAANKKASLDLLSDSGDWHVDTDKGIFTTYDVLSSSVVIVISNLNMIGAGVPWGTSNVIPAFKQTGEVSLCNLVQDLPSSYTLTLPKVDHGSRTSGEVNSPDASWDLQTSGETAYYRLPYSLTSVMSAGDVIPEGFMYLWDNDNNTIKPLVEFIYKDKHSVTLSTTANWLVEGDRYRLILVGSSVTENISYLMSIVRDNNQNGLSSGYDGKTISFANPLSHDNLVDLYNGPIPSATSEIEKYKYVKSTLPVNPHSQYIHRAGSTFDGDPNNYDNSMLGDFSLAGQYNSDINKFPLGWSPTAIGGCGDKTYGIYFGGAQEQNPHILFEGGESGDTRIGFGLLGTGLFSATSYNVYGTVAVHSYFGTPLYLRGKASGWTTSVKAPFESGGSLGFDYNDSNEMNYVKLMAGVRSSVDTYDVPNVAANTGQEFTPTSRLEITPDVNSRFSEEQVREFRFRACSYPDTKIDNSDSIGDQNGESDFNFYFTSPSIVGADWINVYSNAIFFSENGDGKSTSFTKNGTKWLANDAAPPVGVYYEPHKEQTLSGTFKFVTNDFTGLNRATAMELSRYGDSIITSDNITLDAKSDISVTADNLTMTLTGGDLDVTADNVNIKGGEYGSVSLGIDGTGPTKTSGNAYISAEHNIYLSVEAVEGDENGIGFINVPHRDSGILENRRTGNLKWVLMSDLAPTQQVLILV